MECKCGFKNASGAKFCGKCGLALANERDDSLADAAVSSTTTPVPVAPVKASARSSSLVILAVVALVGVAAAAGYWWMHRPPEAEAPVQNAPIPAASGSQNVATSSASSVEQTASSPSAPAAAETAASRSTPRTPPSTLFSVDDHTVALWHLNESSSATVVDATGVNNGTASGTTIVSGRFGAARQFRGGSAGDYVTVPDHPNLRGMSQMTIEAWVYPTSFDLNAWNGGETIVNKGDHTGTYNLYTLDITRNGGAGSAASTFTSFAVGFSLSAGGSGAGVQSTVSHPPGQWYYIAGTYDGKVARIYVNGALEAQSDPVPGVVVTTTDPLYIDNQTWANHGQQSNGRLGGSIDEVRISNVARSPAEIAAASAGN